MSKVMKEVTNRLREVFLAKQSMPARRLSGLIGLALALVVSLIFSLVPGPIGLTLVVSISAAPPKVSSFLPEVAQHP